MNPDLAAIVEREMRSARTFFLHPGGECMRPDNARDVALRVAVAAARSTIDQAITALFREPAGYCLVCSHQKENSDHAKLCSVYARLVAIRGALE